MTDLNQSPESEARPNTSRARTLRTKLTPETRARDFPDSSHRSPNPLIRRGNALSKRGEIRFRLGITDLQMKGVPEITKRVQEGVGSVKEAIAILSGDDAPDSLSFIEKWNSLSPSDQKQVHLEEVVIASGLSTRRFMEILAGACFEHSASVGKIFTAASQLKVLKSTVKSATTKGDVKAQEIFHKITGALATPKGSNFTFNQQITAKSDEPTVERQPLQTMDSWLLEIDDIRKPKQLKAPAEPLIPVEIPEGAPEIEYLDLE